MPNLYPRIYQVTDDQTGDTKTFDYIQDLLTEEYNDDQDVLVLQEIDERLPDETIMVYNELSKAFCNVATSDIVEHIRTVKFKDLKND